jgi:1,3-beta-galactosyl-N-acetylhexosamine phosphorylase
MRAWGAHMVHHALYQEQTSSYAGVIESLSGAPFDVRFISFDDIKENPAVLQDIDVIINMGDAGTAHSGGDYWSDPAVVTAVRSFIASGKGFIGVGEPSAMQHQGHFFQLAEALGVEMETGFTTGYDKYNWDETEHFITDECHDKIDFGEGKRNVYALPGAKVLVKQESRKCERYSADVQLAVNEYYAGRCVYISGLPYSFANSRLLHRAILWAANAEDMLHLWFSENVNVDVHYYPASGKYCVVNNTYEPQSTVVHTQYSNTVSLDLQPNEIKWFSAV